tara:strand:+ start:27883 stop:28266 length:384 start_codon:yes stop_codon:yes gene_type:complete
MANAIENRAMNANIELASVAIVYDGSTAGGAMVSTAMIPADAVVVGVYLNTSSTNGAVLAGTGTIRVAVGGAAQWVTGAIAAGNVKAGGGNLVAGSFTGAIHVTAGGTVSAANGVHYISVAFVRGNA